MSVLNYFSLGSSVSMRSFARLGSAISCLNYAAVGSSMSVRALARLGSSISCFGAANIGAALSVRISYSVCLLCLFAKKKHVSATAHQKKKFTHKKIFTHEKYFCTNKKTFNHKSCTHKYKIISSRCSAAVKVVPASLCATSSDSVLPLPSRTRLLCTVRPRSRASVDWVRRI
jgi:hypothetical protein